MGIIKDLMNPSDSQIVAGLRNTNARRLSRFSGRTSFPKDTTGYCREIRLTYTAAQKSKPGGSQDERETVQVAALVFTAHDAVTAETETDRKKDVAQVNGLTTLQEQYAFAKAVQNGSIKELPFVVREINDNGYFEVSLTDTYKNDLDKMVQKYPLPEVEEKEGSNAAPANPY